MTASNSPDGFVPTPPVVADWIVTALHALDTINEATRILFPGIGTGRIYDAARRAFPDAGFQAVGVERSADRLSAFREDPSHQEDLKSGRLELNNADFIKNPPTRAFDAVLANPPYIALTDIPEADRMAYRETGLKTATGRFDCYQLFFEQSLRHLRDGGALGYLTPIQILTLPTARPLRSIIRSTSPGMILAMPDFIFPNHAVRTVVTTLLKKPPQGNRDYCQLWLEPLQGYDNEFYPIAEAFGYTDTEEKKIAAFREYVASFDEDHRRVNAFDKRERTDGDLYVQPIGEPETVTPTTASGRSAGRPGGQRGLSAFMDG